MTEAMVAARMRVQRALDAVGPEFSGVLLDVCCFLKGLEEIEQGRSWPSRSAKIVLALGLKALARHYGLDQTALPPARPRMRHWGAPDYRPRISEGDAG